MEKGSTAVRPIRAVSNFDWAGTRVFWPTRVHCVKLMDMGSEEFNIIGRRATAYVADTGHFRRKKEIFWTTLRAFYPPPTQGIKSKMSGLAASSWRVENRIVPYTGNSENNLQDLSPSSCPFGVQNWKKKNFKKWFLFYFTYFFIAEMH